MTEQEREDLARRMPNAAALVKLMCGTANNAAWLVVLDGLDHARRCRRYGFKVRGAFNHAIKEWHDYESRLKYATTYRMFKLSDMPEHIRRKYGNISDVEFYNFWASIGGPAYMKTRPLITSLWNKYRLSLVHHKVEDADDVAWVLTAASAIELAVQIHHHAISKCMDEFKIPGKLAHQVFDQFLLDRLSKAWRKALLMLAPDSEFDLEDMERRNIEMGLEQLCQAWVHPSTLYRSTMQSVEDYEEIFATRGFQKKVIREIADVEKETMQELYNNK